MRPSRRALRALLRMREGLDAIIQCFLILRRLRSSRLEGRSADSAAIIGGRRKFFGRAFPGQLGQPLLGRHSGGDRLLGVFVAEFVEAEMAAVDALEAAGERVLIAI